MSDIQPDKKPEGLSGRIILLILCVSLTLGMYLNRGRAMRDQAEAQKILREQMLESFYQGEEEREADRDVTPLGHSVLFPQKSYRLEGVHP